VKEGKVWGTTELLTATPAFEFHRIEIKRGGYCSKHRHHTKSNGFYLESGKLIIRTWRQSGIDTTVLQAGQYTSVQPGLYHQFEAVEDCIAFELYWAEYQRSDIDREDEGGLKVA
jgi:mannose-6-phosphate isomerase-like protein (cupin superfamily)